MNKLIVRILFILVISCTRILPHPPNVTPVTGISLFAGSSMNTFAAFSIPLLIMVISDIVIGFHATIPFVYISFVIITCIGLFLKHRKRFHHLLFASLLSSVVFFIITNFGVWITSSMYQKDIHGLLLCYRMGIPFFRNTLFGDLIYTMGIFYGYRLLTQIVQYKRFGIFLR